MRRTPLHPGASKLKAKGESRFPQRRDPAYRAFVKDHDCAVAASLYNLTREEIAAKGWWPCGTLPERYVVEFAHIKTQGSGGDDRGNGAPLCPVHHDEQEGHTKRFCLKYGLDLYALAESLLVDYERGEQL